MPERLMNLHRLFDCACWLQPVLCRHSGWSKDPGPDGKAEVFLRHFYLWSSRLANRFRSRYSSTPRATAIATSARDPAIAATSAATNGYSL